MISLIVGGARSGKSRYALECGELSGQRLTFLATAQARDTEMTHRIEQHQRERDARWQLIEEPIHVASKLASFSDQDCLVIDCLSLWLSNCLCSADSSCWETEKTQFITELEKSAASIILVSNEVGLGVVPDNKLARQFIDESGWLHQRLAQLSNEVVMMHFGLAQILKS